MASWLVGFWLLLPRPVEPTEPPSLTLDRNAESQVLVEDRHAAEEAPAGEAVLALERLLAAQGRAERGPPETPDAIATRQRHLRQAADRVRREGGPGALAALRARAAEGLAPALSGALPEQERDARLGSFPTMLERYALVVRGRRVAPFFVVRTLFKARFNTLVAAPPTDGFRPVERRAYWGWVALHGTGTDPSLRLSALSHYAEAGGRRIDEAHAVLAFEAGRPAEAARWLDRALDAHGGLRLRNYALGLLP